MKAEEKQKLIEECKEEIENIKWRIDRTIASQGNITYLLSCLKRQEIALAALTAQPVKLPDEMPEAAYKIMSDKFGDGSCMISDDMWSECRAAILANIEALNEAKS